jgi:hypothetical protein
MSQGSARMHILPDSADLEGKGKPSNIAYVKAQSATSDFSRPVPSDHMSYFSLASRSQRLIPGSVSVASRPSKATIQ